MNEERILESIRKKKTRTSGFIHVGEIIPEVLEDIEGRIEENTKGTNIPVHQNSDKRGETLKEKKQAM